MADSNMLSRILNLGIEMKTKQILQFILLHIVFLSTSLSSQQSKEAIYYMDVEIEYFIVAPFKSDFENEMSYDPSEILIREYSKCNMICLNNVDKDDWPDRAINKPYLILYVEAKLLEFGERYGIPEISITEIDFNGNRLSSIWFSSEIKCKKNKIKCTRNAIELFEKKYSDNPFFLGYRNQRIIYPKSGPKFSERDTIQVVKTGITWDSVDELLDDIHSSSIEGVYTSLDSSGAIYTIGIFKSDSTHNIIILDSNLKEWKEGDLKGTIQYNANTNEYLTKWFTATNMDAFPLLSINKDGFLNVIFDESWLRITKKFKRTR